MRGLRLIAAVGRSGQLGLGGAIPWKDPEDMRWFREQTTGGVVIFGHKTFEGLPPIDWSKTQRRPVRWTGEDPKRMLDEIGHLYPERPVWLCGGAKTYAAFMPFVRVAVVTKVDYDGPADVFMPPLW